MASLFRVLKGLFLLLLLILVIQAFSSSLIYFIFSLSDWLWEILI